LLKLIVSNLFFSWVYAHRREEYIPKDINEYISIYLGICGVSPVANIPFFPIHIRMEISMGKGRDLLTLVKRTKEGHSQVFEL